MPKKGKSWPEEGAKLPSKERHVLCILKTTLWHTETLRKSKFALCLPDSCPLAERSLL